MRNKAASSLDQVVSQAKVEFKNGQSDKLRLNPGAGGQPNWNRFQERLVSQARVKVRMGNIDKFQPRFTKITEINQNSDFTLTDYTSLKSGQLLKDYTDNNVSVQLYEINHTVCITYFILYFSHITPTGLNISFSHFVNMQNIQHEFVIRKYGISQPQSHIYIKCKNSDQFIL